MPLCLAWRATVCPGAPSGLSSTQRSFKGASGKFKAAECVWRRRSGLGGSHSALSHSAPSLSLSSM